MMLPVVIVVVGMSLLWISKREEGESCLPVSFPLTCSSKESITSVPEKATFSYDLCSSFDSLSSLDDKRRLSLDFSSSAALSLLVASG